jgi:hypothetical protein
MWEYIIKIISATKGILQICSDIDFWEFMVIKYKKRRFIRKIAAKLVVILR